MDEEGLRALAERYLTCIHVATPVGMERYQMAAIGMMIGLCLEYWRREGKSEFAELWLKTFLDVERALSEKSGRPVQ